MTCGHFPAKVGTCARDRRALQQLALNVHVKHSDLTCGHFSSRAFMIKVRGFQFCSIVNSVLLRNTSIIKSTRFLDGRKYMF